MWREIRGPAKSAAIPKINAKQSFHRTLLIIVVADVSMLLDNVLGVVGAARVTCVSVRRAGFRYRDSEPSCQDPGPMRPPNAPNRFENVPRPASTKETLNRLSDAMGKFELDCGNLNF